MEGSRQIQLIAPAERGSVRLARILAAGVAADAGLSVDDTEDLRIAVSELVALLVEEPEAGGPSIEVTFHRSDGEVTVEGHRRADAPPAGDSAQLDDLVLGILRVVVDDHSYDVGRDGRRFRLVKRARATA
ncbi:MAG: ATP-binding protein [Thermoanaerobacterales bacterium]|jgi:anti-sigma regulatory factor (Ser/Thr protein kinase)|nr:ATP-binding protein [Thermoanaerobacterales bacterium]